MNINELPEEILARILSFLSRSDRLESALTCRRWAQTVARAPLLRDIRLVVDNLEGAETVLANSQRQYENIRLLQASYGNTFWSKIGPTLRELETFLCDSLETFLSMLQACPNLESLTFYDPLPDEIMSEVPQGTKLEKIQKSMRNMRHLNFDFRVNAQMLENLLILMPNVSSIALSNYDTKSDNLSRLKNLLGTSRKITTLGSDIRCFNEDDCERLLRIASGSVQNLTYRGSILAPTVLDALGKCSMLRVLHLYLRRVNDTGVLQNILRNVPELESFSFTEKNKGTQFSREDLRPIFELRKLRHLYLDVTLVTDSNKCVPDEILGDLSRMISLETLRLGSELGFFESTRFRILASMPNLRTLRMRNLRWDAECLEIILFGLERKLKTLIIQNDFDWYDSAFLRDRHSDVDRDTSTPPDRLRSDHQRERKSSSLEILRIEYMPLSDACVAHIAAHHCRLRMVSFHGCFHITDAGLVTLFRHEPLLEELQVSSRENLDGTFLEGLGDLCHRLRSLRVWPPESISAQDLAKFKLRRPRVKYRK